MTPPHTHEATLVQRPAADYLHDELGWESVYAYNNEDFGARKSVRSQLPSRGGSDPRATPRVWSS